MFWLTVSEHRWPWPCNQSSWQRDTSGRFVGLCPEGTKYMTWISAWKLFQEGTVFGQTLATTVNLQQLSPCGLHTDRTDAET